MQRLGLDIIEEARKIRMRLLEKELAKGLIGASNREMILCPLCKYITKRGRPSARIFIQEDKSTAFKCFSCGAWRRLRL